MYPYKCINSTNEYRLKMNQRLIKWIKSEKINQRLIKRRKYLKYIKNRQTWYLPTMNTTVLYTFGLCVGSL